MIRWIFIALSVVSVFVFPWPYTAALGFVSAILFPPMGILLGILMDALYHASGAGLPMWTLYGLIASVIGFFANKFIKGRVSDLSYL